MADTPRPKPTIAELERLLEQHGQDGVEILPSGEVVVRPTREELEAQVSALRQQIETLEAGRPTLYTNDQLRQALVASADEAAAARQEAETLRGQLEAVLKFAGHALTESRSDPISLGDWDAASIQDALEGSGLIEPYDATEPCGERCACAEVSDFPTTCLRVTVLGKAAIAAARRVGGGRDDHKAAV